MRCSGPGYSDAGVVAVVPPPPSGSLRTVTKCRWDSWTVSRTYPAPGLCRRVAAEVTPCSAIRCCVALRCNAFGDAVAIKYAAFRCQVSPCQRDCALVKFQSSDDKSCTVRRGWLNPPVPRLPTSSVKESSICGNETTLGIRIKRVQVLQQACSQPTTDLEKVAVRPKEVC